MALPDKIKVYRLRNLPGHVDRQSAAELFSACIDDASPQDIRISSLAYTVDPWARPPTKIATLTFEKVSGDHQYDCIAISGLASHPFGSWQPHGRNKSFMWIRDELPQSLPTVRFILYGYDTILHPSKSFQRVPDLANSFIDVLRADGWTSPTAKPLLFLAHSLGGVLLKQTLLMLAGSGQQQVFIANLIKGAIFFGVPSHGMAVNDIFTMLGDQPNKKALITDISAESNYLPQLEKQFSGVSFVRTMKMYWAYETKMTPTVASRGNGFSRSGPDTVLVTRNSATGGRCIIDPSLTIQIDENHSDMVKFSNGDHRMRIIANRLADICGISWIPQPPDSGTVSTNAPANNTMQHPQNQQVIIGLSRSQVLIEDPIFWDDETVLKSLHAPERDVRLQQIDPRASYTFDWVYDKASIGLSQWLQRGQGIFWISGKPGSGKSTMMKFIHSDQRTSEFLHNWKSRAQQIMVSFFFHHRGNATQKSFEGLLRSIISQLLEAEPLLFQVIRSMFDEEYHKRVNMKGLGSLQLDILGLTRSCKIEEDARLDHAIENVIRSEDLHTSPHQAAVNLDSKLHLLIKSREVQSHRTAVNHQLLPEPANQQDLQRQEQEQSFADTIDENIKKIVQRQQSRINIQTAIQNEEWSRSRLEDALLRICSQSLLDLDLIFLLDALDEYDGRPEFISGFLKDLVQDTSFSQTHIRILFSSRHWNVFQSEFEACPGFKIHEHTGGDIRDYCITSICDTFQPPGSLLQFVEEIVARSSGVFLWVRLVLHDLFRIMEEHDHTRGQVEDYLREALDSLPDELEEYYGAIIDRIPFATRWDTYVVLESLARYRGYLTADQLCGIVTCSTSKACYSYDQWLQVRMLHDNLSPEHFIRNVSGGLVDIVHPNVQLMHQTVKDFIEAPQFRQLVLGRNRANITEENGHSFLAKFLYLDGLPDIEMYTGRRALTPSFTFHAREAERTTGLSQYNYFAHVQDPWRNKWQSSQLDLAAFAGLQLFLEDAHKENSSAIPDSTILISSLEDGMDDGLLLKDGRKIARSLLSKGFVVDKDPGGLGQIMSKIWTRNPLHGPDEDYTNLASDLVNHLKATEIRIDWDTDHTGEHGLVKYYGKPLHLSPPNVAAGLLERGADPNAPDSIGRSPLDYILSEGSLHTCDPAHLYKMSLLLIKHGGLLRITKRDEWLIYLHHLEKNGFKTQIFQDFSFPAWCDVPAPHIERKYSRRRGTSRVERREQRARVKRRR
ncbi:hypothetical protein F4677DRAFT_459687 [Hypoxylon crocopeplum]|nr:hypothetical protein F4677DRAFT_459687 [Hypoxylon crocopeplum]